MKLLSDIVLCDRSYATKVTDTYYFMPRTVLKASGYVYDWVTKNLILELHLNASSNIRDYSVYTEEQEADLLKVFFPTLDVDEAFARLRSICLISVSTIYKCYQIEIDTENKPQNNLWCGMPYHIFRLYLGMYYDALVAAPDEATFKSIWFPECFADNVYYRLLSAYIHVALNTPGEIIMGTDLGDYDDFLEYSSGSEQGLVKIVDRGQRYLQKASEFIATTFKGKQSNEWVTSGDSVLNCPLTRNIMNTLLKCCIGLSLVESDVMRAMELQNITVVIDGFQLSVYTTHDNKIYPLSAHALGAVYSARMTDKRTYKFLYDGEGPGDSSRINIDISSEYGELNYNRVLDDLQAQPDLIGTGIENYEPLDFMDIGYFVTVDTIVSVFAHGTTRHPVPAGLIVKDIEDVEYFYIPSIGWHLEKLDELGVNIEGGLPVFRPKDVSFVDWKALHMKHGKLNHIQLNIDTDSAELNFALILEAFASKQGVYARTRIPRCIFAQEEDIMEAYRQAGYYNIG